MRPLLVVLAAAASLTAQTTLVVDALGGPGTFPTIGAALVVAQPDDIVEVHAQPNTVYRAFQTAVGVHVIGVGDRAVQPFTVANLPVSFGIVD